LNEGVNKAFAHVVVDGSNIATEGRSDPSLRQLNEAVLAFMKEFPGTKVTVVVDATFGHRIDRRERAEFDAAINNNELVAPPAGAVGRGDGFVLTIADKVKASVLSNDSYQEFHDQYKWLFDEGRLLGGKPVPNVGWVFIRRLPVRKQAGRATASSVRRIKPRPSAVKPPVAKVATTKSVHPKLNELNPFLNFVEKNSIGTKVRGVVESYASHGVYVKIGEVSGYLPLRLMAKPAPRSAREHVKLGATLSLVVVGFTPSRRSVELSVAGVETPSESKVGARVQGSRGTQAKSVPAKTSQPKKPRRRAQHAKNTAKKATSNKKR